MNLPKRATDFFTIMGFVFATMVATLLLTGVMKYVLMLAVFYAIQWSFDRNVEYGMNLVIDMSDEEDVRLEKDE